MTGKHMATIAAAVLFSATAAAQAGPQVVVSADAGCENELGLLLEDLRAEGIDARVGNPTDGAEASTRAHVQSGCTVLSVVTIGDSTPARTETLEARGAGPQDRRDVIARAAEAIRASLIPVQRAAADTVTVHAPASQQPTADVPMSPPASRRRTVLVVGAGADAIATWATRCKQDLDVIGCSPGAIGLAGVQIASSAQFSAHWAGGIRGAVDWGGDQNYSMSPDGLRTKIGHQLLRGSIMGIFLPLDTPSLWVAAESGVAAMRKFGEVIAADGSNAGPWSDTQTGALIGGAVGYDIRASDSWLVGVETRATFLGIREQAGVGDGWSYGPSFWLSAGFSLRYTAGL